MMTRQSWALVALLLVGTTASAAQPSATEQLIGSGVALQASIALVERHWANFVLLDQAEDAQVVLSWTRRTVGDAVLLLNQSVTLALANNSAAETLASSASALASSMSATRSTPSWSISRWVLPRASWFEKCGTAGTSSAALSCLANCSAGTDFNATRALTRSTLGTLEAPFASAGSLTNVTLQDVLLQLSVAATAADVQSNAFKNVVDADATCLPCMESSSWHDVGILSATAASVSVDAVLSAAAAWGSSVSAGLPPPDVLDTVGLFVGGAANFVASIVRILLLRTQWVPAGVRPSLLMACGAGSVGGNLDGPLPLAECLRVAGRAARDRLSVGEGATWARTACARPLLDPCAPSRPPVEAGTPFPVSTAVVLNASWSANAATSVDGAPMAPLLLPQLVGYAPPDDPAGHFDLHPTIGLLRSGAGGTNATLVITAAAAPAAGSGPGRRGARSYGDNGTASTGLPCAQPGLRGNDSTQCVVCEAGLYCPGDGLARICSNAPPPPTAEYVGSGAVTSDCPFRCLSDGQFRDRSWCAPAPVGWFSVNGTAALARCAWPVGTPQLFFASGGSVTGDPLSCAAGFVRGAVEPQASGPSALCESGMTEFSASFSGLLNVTEVLAQFAAGSNRSSSVGVSLMGQVDSWRLVLVLMLSDNTSSLSAYLLLQTAVHELFPGLEQPRSVPFLMTGNVSSAPLPAFELTVSLTAYAESQRAEFRVGGLPAGSAHFPSSAWCAWTSGTPAPSSAWFVGGERLSFDYGVRTLGFWFGSVRWARFTSGHDDAYGGSGSGTVVSPAVLSAAGLATSGNVSVVGLASPAAQDAERLAGCRAELGNLATWVVPKEARGSNDGFCGCVPGSFSVPAANGSVACVPCPLGSRSSVLPRATLLDCRCGSTGILPAADGTCDPVGGADPAAAARTPTPTLLAPSAPSAGSGATLFSPAEIVVNVPAGSVAVRVRVGSGPETVRRNPPSNVSVTLLESASVEVVAEQPGALPSAAAVGNYTVVTVVRLLTPWVWPPLGTSLGGPALISLAANGTESRVPAGAVEVRYTLDGSAPGPGSPSVPGSGGNVSVGPGSHLRAASWPLEAPSASSGAAGGGLQILPSPELDGLFPLAAPTSNLSSSPQPPNSGTSDSSSAGGASGSWTDQLRSTWTLAAGGLLVAVLLATSGWWAARMMRRRGAQGKEPARETTGAKKSKRTSRRAQQPDTSSEAASDGNPAAANSKRKIGAGKKLNPRKGARRRGGVDDQGLPPTSAAANSSRHGPAAYRRDDGASHHRSASNELGTAIMSGPGMDDDVETHRNAQAHGLDGPEGEPVVEGWLPDV